jgi:hypothetical protein
MSLTDEDKTWIGAAIAASEQRTIEAVRDVETKLLTEFHKWASPMEMRVRSHSSVLRAVDADLEYLTGRVEKLERPPQPPQ